MARLPRFFVPRLPLHVIQRGNNRQSIFREPLDRRRFLALLGESAKRHAVSVHAYVLMPNHVHLLATPVDQSGVARLMQSVCGVYVGWYNHRYARTGTLWEGRYRASIVDHERYLLACMRYIELNAVRAGIVLEPSEFRWSSYRCNALGDRDEIVDPHPAYISLGITPEERRAAYRELVRLKVPASELDLIRSSTHHEWALGDATFRESITRVGRRAAPLPRGRPRKHTRNGPENLL